MDMDKLTIPIEVTPGEAGSLSIAQAQVVHAQHGDIDHRMIRCLCQKSLHLFLRKTFLACVGVLLVDLA